MAVDYTPSFDPADVDSDYGSTGGDITVPTFSANMKPFRFWCQRALPLVYDDSLSYYEVLCKVVDQMNGFLTDLQTATGSIEDFAEQFVTNQTFLNNMATKLGQDVDELETYINERMEDFTTAYNQLQSYVNNYFDNLDVQQEINNKLDAMADDGTFNTLFDPVITAWMTEKTAQIDTAISNQDAIQAQQNARISVLEGRMDGFSSLPSGSTSGNAELLDIRTNFLGETYPTAGDAVRASDMIASGFQSIGFTRLEYWDGNEESSPYDTIVFDVAAYKGGHVVVIANTENFVQRINDAYGASLYGSNVSGKTVDNTAVVYPFPDGYSGFTNPVFKNYTVLSTSIQREERIMLQLSIPNDFPFQYLKLGGIEQIPLTTHTTPEAIVYATSWSKTPVDNTLSIAGDAADAKATGDAIRPISDGLSNANIIYPFSKTAGYITANGETGAAGTSTKEKYTSLIPVKTGDFVSFAEKHTISHSLWCAYALYDETETFISRTVLTNNTETDYYSGTAEITNPLVKYIAFTYRSYGDASVTIFNGFVAKLESVKKSSLKVLGSINSTSDLNDLKEAGFYITRYNNLPLNSPTNVRQGVVIIMPDSSAVTYPFINQTFIDIYSGVVYTRSKGGGASGTWGNWNTKVWYTSLGSLNSANDLNSLTKEGYYITGYNNNPTNSPSNVRQGFVIVMPESTSNANPFTCQMFVDIYSGTLYVRSKSGGGSGVWGNWQTKNTDLVWNEAKNSTLISTYMESNSSNISVTGDRIRILSYNVAHYNNDSATYIDALPEKLCNFKKLLMFVRADVLSIPEDDEYIDSADTKDSTAWLYKPIYPFKVGGGSCCVHSKTTLIKSKNITLPGGWTIRRGDISVGNKTLSVYSVHLTVLSEEDRATELEQIFSQIATDDPTYYVIAGDMNCIEEGEKETFKATCESHGCTLANGGYLGWLNTHKNNLALDNIVVSNNIIIENTEVLGNWYESLYSDHYPIFCDLVLLNT